MKYMGKQIVRVKRCSWDVMFYDDLITGNGFIISEPAEVKIDKDEYTKLFKFEILQETDAKVVFDELKIMADLDFDVRTYLTFRDELAKDIEKNKAIFNNSEEQRTIKK